MKKLVVFALAAYSSVAVSASRDIQDLIYLPSAGTSYGFTDFDYISGELKSSGDKTDITGFGITQTVGRSFTDRFSLQAELGYSQVIFDPEDDKDTDQTGLYDPIITGRFRTMDDDLRWDVFGGLVVGLGDSKIESSGDRNNATGGSSFFLGTQVGKKLADLQWSFTAKLQHNLSRDEKDEQIPDDYKISPHNEWLFGGDVQKQFNTASLVRGFVSANFTQTADIDKQSSEISPSTEYIVGAEYRHLMSETLMLKASLARNTINQDTGTNEDFGFWNLGFGANYQF